MTDSPQIIDAHAMLGRESYLELDASELLRRMDAAGVEMAIARPMGMGLVVDNQTGNDTVLRAHSRIRGLVSANPWWGPKALHELDRCRSLGAVGLFLDPLRQGFFPTEQVAAGLFEKAAEYDWPVLVRTGAYVFADVLALAEIARRYPETPFIAGFGGFADMWFELPGVFETTPNLYLDASMIWAEGIQQIVAAHGPSRVLFGGAEPRNRYAVNLRALNRLELPKPSLDAILHLNARRVFRLEENSP